MTSRSNSFRLQRLTKTVGIRDHSNSEHEPRQTLKLAALNSINLGVKYNDLSYISGRDLNKLRKEPEVGDDLQYQSAHQNLSGVRKNYDSMHKKKQSRQASITKLKEQQKKLEIMQGQLVDNKNTAKKKVSDLNKRLEDIKLMYTQSDMQKKVLLNLCNRLKSDKIVYDQRKFDQEKQLRFLRKQKQVIITDKTDLNENDDRTNKMYKKFLAQLKEEQNQRDTHIRSLEAMIESKQRVGELNMYRSQQMQDIAERAMQDKDENQKNWQKLYLTNKFLAKMLRDKMDKQMNKFFVVESAFKTIKIATGVNDAQTLVQKFLSKQSTYGDLLGKIADNEKRIEILKQQSQELRHQHKQLENQRQILENTKIEEVKLDEEMKKLSMAQAKQKKSALETERVRAWIQKNIRKINSMVGKNYSIKNQRNLKTIAEDFISYLKYISQVTEEIQKKESAVEEKFSPNEKIKNEKKLLRIKQRKDSGVIDEESEDQGNLNYEEGDLISGQRNQIHKINERFLKEAKRRHEQNRRLKAEQASPKKKQAEPKKKQPQADS